MFPKLRVPPKIAVGFLVFIVLLGAWFWFGLADLLAGGGIQNIGERVRYGGRPLVPVVFPDVRNFDSLEIRLEVADEEGPDYAVTVRGDGQVVFDGHDSVTLVGRYTARLDQPAVQALLEDFRSAQFFWLKSIYDKPDHLNQRPAPTHRLAIAFDDKAMAVREHRGRELGMPSVLLDLIDKVDSAAGTGRWIVGDATTVPTLKSQGFDLTVDHPQNGALLVAAARAANLRVTSDLIAAGAPVKGVYGCQALSATAFGREYKAVYELLARSGAPIKASDCEVPSEWPGLSLQ